jgi:hypothetical protein
MDQLRAMATDGVLPPWARWFGDDAMRELVHDANLRVALEREMPRLPLSYVESAVPLPDAWLRRPSAYLLLTPDAYGQSAAEAEALGWPVRAVRDAHHLSNRDRSRSPRLCSRSSVATRNRPRLSAAAECRKARRSSDGSSPLGLVLSAEDEVLLGDGVANRAYKMIESGRGG